MEEEEEIDDDEEELELDDVEPVIEGAAVTNGDAVRKPRVLDNVIQSSRRRVGPLKFVRTADGKGYMRRQTDNLLQKAKATAFRVAAKKKRRRFFRGGNYRFDGKRPQKSKKNQQLQSVQTVPDDNHFASNEAASSEDNFLSYLGIQRKNSDAEATESVMEDPDQVTRSISALPKAKKSFRTGIDRYWYTYVI